MIPPTPPEMLSIHAAYQAMMAKIADAIGDDYEIAPQAGFLIAAIGDQCVKPSDITARRWCGTNTTYSLTRLIRLGLAVETPCTYDARRKYISLTSDGLELARRIRLAIMTKQSQAA
jgi:DNA-binding MarR family transcriptional regulator